MYLLVGLGNSGTRYRGNRHNAGFMAIDAIADSHPAGPFRQKFQGLIADATLGDARALLLKPQTFYNSSGDSVAAAAKFYKIDADAIVIFHDEIDLAPGKIRVKKGGGLAGNNGLRSTAAHLGPEFWRVRIGVGHPGHKDAVTAHVLGDFSKAERNDIYDGLFERLGKAAALLLPPSDVTAGKFMSAISQPGANPKTADEKPRPPRNTAVPKQTVAEAEQSPFDALKALKPGIDKDG